MHEDGGQRPEDEVPCVDVDVTEVEEDVVDQEHDEETVAGDVDDLREEVVP